MTLLPSLFSRPLRSRPFSRSGFDDLFEQMTENWSPFVSELNATNLRVDVQQTDNEYIVKADLPGFKKESINATLDDRVLTISAQDERENEEKSADFLMRERRYASCQRSIPLPFANPDDQVKAEFKDGVLELRVKKSADKQSKRIAIQ